MDIYNPQTTLVVDCQETGTPDGPLIDCLLDTTTSYYISGVRCDKQGN